MIILKKLVTFLVQQDFKQFRAKQVVEAVYKRGINDFNQINNIPKKLQKLLSENYSIKTLRLLKTASSQSGDAIKYLYQTTDFKKIETVLMNFKDGRHTICVSSQVGCKLGCKFCATGKMGFSRDLHYSEICDQILNPHQELLKKKQRISNVVYMGMGEPLLNYENVIESIKYLNDKSYYNIGARSITISTSGITQGIDKLADEKMQCNLAISLHAPNQLIREKIMPVAKMYPLEQLMQSVDNYIKKTNRRITYEYIMLKNINDSPQNALELADLIKDQLCHVNLIPYNATDVQNIEGSEKREISRFKEILEKHNIAATIRVSLGQEIEAACGQLANKS